VGLYRYPTEIDIDAALAACTTAVAARPDLGRFQYQLGRAQQASGDFEAALASFETALAAGHTRAATAVAALLTTRRVDRSVFDIPDDPVRAAELLDAGIEKGDPYAMLARGVPLLRERLTPEDRTRGFELIDRASELGHTYAMNWLGFYYNEEDSDHLIPARGVAYLTASAERQDVYGYYGLGMMARRGVDRDAPDYALAYDLFQKAAEGGHPTAPTWIGRMIMREELGTPDPVAALGWYDQGLERGDGFAGVNGARIILDGAAPGQGPEQGAIRAAKAALLPAEEAKVNANEILAGLDAVTLGIALQTLLADLGEPVAVDGNVGPGTLSALGRVQETVGLPGSVPDAPADRLIAAARVYWALNPVRPDVF
jgi:TPR repeat protein